MNVIEMEMLCDSDPQLFWFKGYSLNENVIRKVLDANGFEMEGIERIIEGGDIEDDNHFVFNDEEGSIRIILHRSAHILTLT